MDTTVLEAAPAIIREASEHHSTWRVYLVTTYSDGSTWHRTGYIGKTTGTRPAFLLMHDSRAIGSSDLLTESTWGNTEVAGVQRGPDWGYYLNGRKVSPGRNRYEN